MDRNENEYFEKYVKPLLIELLIDSGAIEKLIKNAWRDGYYTGRAEDK